MLGLQHAPSLLMPLDRLQQQHNRLRGDSRNALCLCQSAWPCCRQLLPVLARKLQAAVVKVVWHNKGLVPFQLRHLLLLPDQIWPVKVVVQGCSSAWVVLAALRHHFGDLVCLGNILRYDSS